MHNSMRIVFMGTPDFAVESLKSIHSSKHHVAGVVTVPDKPAGRGHQVESSPVKKYAEQAGIAPILQPQNLKDPVFLQQLSALKPDLILVVAFRMLPEAVWMLPPRGTVNLHASLLPNYRGAAPINWAIINGEKKTGITTFFIEKEIDTGNIIFQEETVISNDMNAGELHDILMVKGAGMVVKTIDAIAEKRYEAIAQQKILTNKKLQPAPKIFKEDCKINWQLGAEQIHNLIRGLSPYPTAWTELFYGDQVIPVKIFRSSVVKTSHTHPAGTLVTDNKNQLSIAVKDGFVEIGNLQQAGKKRMDTGEFLRGFQGLGNYKLLI
jgi:methionyl-tRNA formyltransferase